MIFWRIVDNKLYSVGRVNNLGFEKSEGLQIPDEYLERQLFTIMRTCHGIGDWGIISAMPRLLKEKYPDCKVFVPSVNLLEEIFGQYKDNWGEWENPFQNVVNIFKNNPYVDGFREYISGEVFHDHYRVYDNDNTDVPLVKQMLEFWQFTEKEMEDCQPELYWSDEEKEFGDEIIKEYVNVDFGCLLVSDRFGTQNGKYDEKSYNKDAEVIAKVLKDNPLPYFYYTPNPISETPFDFIDKALDMRYIDLRIQLYIKSQAIVNVSNQCGTSQIVTRYSKCYESQRQYPIAHNFVEGGIYL